MTQSNPFAQQAAPAEQSAPAAAAANPFGQQAAAPVAAPAPTAAAAANPFGQQAAPVQAPAPTAQQWAAPAPAAQSQQWATGAATYPPAQQQYAQPQQQTYAPAPVAQQAPPALDPNALRGVGAPPPTGGKGAQLPDMYGRLVVMFPMQIDTVPRRPEHITAEQRAAGNVNQQRLTATVVVLDSGPGTQPGGTIMWGGKPHGMPPVPHTNQDPLPYVRKGMWINQTKIVQQAASFLPAGPGAAPTPMVGRPVKTGPEHNAPWYLAEPSQADIALAQQYISLVMAGTFPHPLAP